MDLYPRLLEQKLLERNDCREIARLLHHELRVLMRSKKPIIDITERVRDFVKYYKRGLLPPSSSASLHIISFYKESKQYDSGIEFWNWVIQQNDQYVQLNTYGAAIELLAVFGKDLSYCEAVYAHALKRFPKNFNEYHLSHGAIVPFRGEPTVLLGTSMVLLQGIMTARLIHGDWRNAYLTLDTALRLHPTQVPNHFIDLILSERPIHEALQVFCLTCESGNKSRDNTPTVLLDLLGKTESIDLDKSHKLQYATAMITVLHSFLAGRGKVNAIHLGVFLDRTLQLALSGETDGMGPQVLVDEQIIKLASQVMEVFAALGVFADERTFNIIITNATKFRRGTMVAWAIELLESSGIHPSESARHGYLAAAGESRNASAVESIWNTHCQLTHATGAKLRHNDWKALANAARRADNAEFVYRQMDIYAVMDDEELVQKIISELEQIPDEHAIDHVINTSEFQHGNQSKWLSTFLTQLTSLQTIIVENRYRNMKETPIVRDEIWVLPQGVNEAWSSKLYNELSVDPAGSVPVEVTSCTNPTGFSLDELRYRNWRAINQLLIQAEAFEIQVKNSVEQAIKQGTPLEEAKSLRNIRNEAKQLKALSKNLGIHLQTLSDNGVSTMTEEEWRNKILTLRSVRS